MGRYDDYYDRQDEYRREEYRREDYARDERRYDEIREHSTREMYEDWDNQDARRDQEERTSRFFHALRNDNATDAMGAIGLGLEYWQAQLDAATPSSSEPAEPKSDVLSLDSEWVDLSTEHSKAVSDSDKEQAESIVEHQANMLRRMTEINEHSLHRLRKLFDDSPGS